MFLRHTITALALAGAVACGGTVPETNSSSMATAQDALQTASVVDRPVQGHCNATVTQEKTTNAAGQPIVRATCTETCTVNSPEFGPIGVNVYGPPGSGWNAFGQKTRAGTGTVTQVTELLYGGPGTYGVTCTPMFRDSQGRYFQFSGFPNMSETYTDAGGTPPPPCQVTCESLGATCGEIPNTCGGLNGPNCGTCALPQTCGGGGVANTCGVPPPVTNVTISLSASGRSGITVSSNPAGLSVAVGSSGSGSFVSGNALTLSVSGGRSAIFSGACSTSGSKKTSCTFSPTANGSVSANVQ